MERVRHLFIINPAAGKHMDTVGIQKEIKTAMADRNEPWEVMLTKGSGDAETLSRAWAEQSSDPLRIYAMGGDGTLNEVVNGVVGCDHVSVGCCPLGSGNDFVKTFGRENWRFRDLRSLVEAKPHTMDLIECNGRYAINVCSVGFDARIGLGMADYKRLPLVTGKGAYLVSLVVTTIQGVHRPYELELDGEKLSGEYTLLCACNGQWYGGSFRPVPEAQPDDGMLDFVLVKGVSRLTVASLVGKFATGQGKNYPELIQIRRGYELKVKCDRMSMVNIDGERLDTDSLSFALSAKKLPFLLPEGVVPVGSNK